jgi:hypothetical protein
LPLSSGPLNGGGVEERDRQGLLVHESHDGLGRKPRLRPRVEEPYPPQLMQDGDGQVLAQRTKGYEAPNEVNRHVRAPSDLVELRAAIHCIPRHSETVVIALTRS